MSTLLVLGSKPDPALPPRESFDQLACANASGYSAARHGMPVPAFTVMSAILTSGIDSGRQSLNALAGLRTRDLYFFALPITGSPLKRAFRQVRALRMKPFCLKWRLRALAYGYDRFFDPGWEHYKNLIESLCDHDPRILAQVRRKQPSTGLMAVALGLAQGRYERLIVSGFSFELSHAYGLDPQAAGRTSNRHADTDVAVLGYLAGKYGNIVTTESVVHARAGVPLFGEPASPDAHRG